MTSLLVTIKILLEKCIPTYLEPIDEYDLDWKVYNNLVRTKH